MVARVLLCAVLVCPLLSTACAIPHTVEALGDRSPPPEFGRPAWVRTCAGVGAWVGGVLGGVVAIVALPITWPLSELAGDGLGEQGSNEVMLFPALGGAAIGHALLGTPPDVLDWVFRRAWVDSPDPLVPYDFVPLPPAAEPVQPAAPAPAAGTTAAPPPVPAPRTRT